MIPRLKEQYDKLIIENLKKKLSVTNKLMVPKFVKIILNMGLGKDAQDKKKLQNCMLSPSSLFSEGPENEGKKERKEI